MITKLSNSKFLIPAMVTLVILATGAGFYISLKQSQNQLVQNNETRGLFWPNPKQIKNFSAKDHNGNAFELSNISGKWSFIFFGYTNCPDICPITMSVMANVYQHLVSYYENIQIIFVTVDPERDTTEKLSSYISFFDQDFVGLSGEPAIENSLTRQIGIPYYYNKKKENNNYLVDHSASIFVIDPKTRLIAKLSPPHQPEKIIEQFKKIKRFIDAKD